MYPASSPLVPDDQFHERDFAPRDLDAERDFNEQRRRRPPRPSPVKRPSVVGRMVRAVSRFFAAILIGVGLTLAWQSHADEVNAALASWAPALAWLLPEQTPKQPAEAAVSSAISSEVAQQVKLIAVDLAIVRRNIGQLAANQDQFAAKQNQMNQNIATLQQIEQDARLQAAAPPAAKTVRPAAHNPPPTPLQTAPR